MGVVLTPVEHVILREEGFSPRVYKDSLGKATSGIGFRTGPGAGRKFANEEEAIKLLQSYYVHKAQSEAQAYIGPDVYNKLTGAQQLVLTDMAYNLGAGGLGTFKKL